MDSRGTVRALFALFMAVVIGGATVVFIFQLASGMQGNNIPEDNSENNSNVVYVGNGLERHRLYRWVDESGLICYESYSRSSISCASPPPSKGN